jgi:hypothetical protein
MSSTTIKNNHHLFKRVPSQLFQEIREFLLEKEYYMLITVANEFFADVKHETWQVFVKADECKTFLEDEGFQRQVLGLMKEPLHQLNLISSGSLSLMNFDKFISFPSQSLNTSSFALHEVNQWPEKISSKQSVTFCGNRDIENFALDPNNNRLKKVCLSLFENLKQVSFLRHLQELTLESCYQLVDVNCFHNIPKLTIKLCPRVSDISRLGKVHSLTLEECQRIEDVSSLTDNYSVTLRFCYNSKKSVFRFTNVHRLSVDVLNSATESLVLAREALTLKHLTLLNYCDEILHLSPLLVSLHVSLYLNSSVRPRYLLNTFQLLQDVTINYFNTQVDFSPLKRTPIVRLYQCSFETLNGLGDNRYIRVERCKLLSDFSALKDVSRVEIIDCQKLKNGQDLLNVENLMIRQCNEIEDLSMLTNLKYVFLQDCDRINGKVLSLSSLITVEVLGCQKIRSYGAVFQESGRNIMKVVLNLKYKGAIEKLNEENNHLYHLEERKKLTNLYPSPVVILLRNPKVSDL